jgi:hypothetical protein
MKAKIVAAVLAGVALLNACSDDSDQRLSPSSLTVVATAAPEGAAGYQPNR